MIGGGAQKKNKKLIGLFTSMKILYVNAIRYFHFIIINVLRVTSFLTLVTLFIMKISMYSHRIFALTHVYFSHLPTCPFHS